MYRQEISAVGLDSVALCTEWMNSHTKRFLQQIHNLERERQKIRTAKMYEHRLCLHVLMAFWEYENKHLDLFLLSLSWHSSFIRDQKMNELLNLSPFVCHLLPLMQAGRGSARTVFQAWSSNANLPFGVSYSCHRRGYFLWEGSGVLLQNVCQQLAQMPLSGITRNKKLWGQ